MKNPSLNKQNQDCLICFKIHNLYLREDYLDFHNRLGGMGFYNANG